MNIYFDLLLYDAYILWIIKSCQWKLYTVLKVLILANNKLTNVDAMFYDSLSLSELNLANNAIEKITLNIKMNISVLNIKRNPIQFVFFLSKSHIGIVITDRQLACCYFPKSHCNFDFEDTYSCNDSPIFFGVLIVIILGVIPAVTLNIANICVAIHKLHQSPNQVKKSEFIFQININTGNLVFQCYLLFLVTTQSLFNSQEHVIEYMLSNVITTPRCTIMKSAVLVFIIIAPLLYLQQLFHRLRVLRSLTPIYSLKSVYVQLVFAWLLTAIIIVSVGQFSITNFQHVCQSYLCFPFLATIKRTLFDKIFLCCVLGYQCLLFHATAGTYFKIIHVVYKSTQKVRSSAGTNRLKTVVARVLVLLFIKLAVVLPFVLLLLQTLNVVIIADYIMTAMVICTLLLDTIIQPIVMFLT